MKRFFDSSVLIPVFYADHVDHASSTRIFLDASKEDFCALHTLGEVYATLTGLPLRPRITGSEGLNVVAQILDRLTVVSLTEEEYLSALRLAAAEKIVGAAAYDMLIAQCALKAGAKELVTWNVRDFTRFGVTVAGLVKTPSDS